MNKSIRIALALALLSAPVAAVPTEGEPARLFRAGKCYFAFIELGNDAGTAAARATLVKHRGMPTATAAGMSFGQGAGWAEGNVYAHAEREVMDGLDPDVTRRALLTLMLEDGKCEELL
jgi:hypothetical protein